MFLYIFKIIIKLIITSSQFDPGSTSVRPQNPWTSPFYGSMNGPGLKTLFSVWILIMKEYNKFLLFDLQETLRSERAMKLNLESCFDVSKLNE